jgi:hypothetical protein
MHSRLSSHDYILTNLCLSDGLAGLAQKQSVSCITGLLRAAFAAAGTARDASGARRRCRGACGGRSSRPRLVSRGGWSASGGCLPLPLLFSLPLLGGLASAVAGFGLTRARGLLGGAAWARGCGRCGATVWFGRGGAGRGGVGAQGVGASARGQRAGQNTGNA